MARNLEKSNLLLNKWVSMKEQYAKSERSGGAREERRPYLASECRSLPDAERWRRMVIGELSRKVSEIQNAGLGEARLRDLNDEINKSIREKGHWERQIRALGGPDHAAVSARLFEGEGRELPGSRGYRYFGAAKDLPGVRELFEGAAVAAAAAGGGGAAWRGRADLARLITPDYYGWRDEEDGTLVEHEGRREAAWRAEGVAAWEAARAAAAAAGGGGAGGGGGEGSLEPQLFASSGRAGMGALLAPRVLSAGEMAAALDARRRELLVEKYA